MSSLFEAYITNLGKYNEGRLVGETLKFPATTEEVQALLKRIGVDGVRYEEIFITSFDGDVLGLYDHSVVKIQVKGLTFSWLGINPFTCLKWESVFGGCFFKIS